jgi:hypothetical protein
VKEKGKAGVQVSMDEDCKLAADEIGRLRGIEDAAKKAADIYEAEIERLREEIEFLTDTRDAAIHDNELLIKEVSWLRAKLAEYESAPVRLRHIMTTGKMPPDEMK